MTEVDTSFYQLGGLQDIHPVDKQEAIVVEMRPATVNVPQVNGIPVGVLAEQSRNVKMIQLELADTDDLLFPNFNYEHPETDPNFAAYCAALDDRGVHIEPLHVLPINKIVSLQGQDLPKFAVYDDPIQFVAMQTIGRAEAAIIIESGRHPGELLIQALSRTQHQYKPSVLDQCDVAAKLDSYGYDQRFIATHMAKDSDTSARIDQATISRMIAVSHLPPEVRAEIAPKRLTRSHAELLATKRLAANPEAQIQLAKWTLQGAGKSVKDLEAAIALCFPEAGKPAGHIEVHTNGSIEVVDDTFAVALMSDKQRLKPTVYPVMTPFQRDEILQTAQSTYHSVRVRLADDGNICAVGPSLTGLANWVRGALKREEIPFHEIEAMTYALNEALRNAARQQELLQRNGTIAAVSEKTTIVEE
jgi:hypothetical protein